MTKLELGTKRLCAHCGAKFYDLHQDSFDDALIEESDQEDGDVIEIIGDDIDLKEAD